MLLLLALLHPLLDPLFLVMGKQLEMVGPLLMVPYYMVVLLLDLKLDLLVHLSLLFMLVLLVPFFFATGSAAGSRTTAYGVDGYGGVGGALTTA